MTDLCECGHPREAHEHYRMGNDCGTCGIDVCSRWRPLPDAGPTLLDLATKALRTAQANGAIFVGADAPSRVLAVLVHSGYTETHSSFTRKGVVEYVMVTLNDEGLEAARVAMRKSKNAPPAGH